MNPELVYYLIIILGALFSFVVSRIFYDNTQGSPNTSAMARYVVFETVLVLVVIYFSNAGNRYVGGPSQAFGRLMFFVVAWIPTIIVWTPLLTEYFANTTVGNMFFPPVNKPVRNSLGKVKALLWDEEPNAAFKVCLEEFDTYPDEPDILLDGALLFHDRGLYHEAVRLLETAHRAFNDDDKTWSVAMYQAACIYVERLGDGERARSMFRQIAARVPGSEVGMRSIERMHGEKPVVAHEEADKWHHKLRTREQAVAGMDDVAKEIVDPFYKKPKAPQATPPPSVIEEEEMQQPARLEDAMPGMFIDEEPKP